MSQQTWLQQAQVAVAGSSGGGGMASDEAVCIVLAKLDQELSSFSAVAFSADDCRAYVDVDGFLLQQVLVPAASARLQALACQVLVKLAGPLPAATWPALVDFPRLWKHAVERDESAVRLMPVVASCQDPTLLRDSIIPQLVRWVSTRGFESRLQRVALLALTRITARQVDIITDEQVLIISCQLAEWLKGAGTVQATSPTKRWKDVAARPGSTGSSGATAVVKESDGTATTADFFTVLNVGQYYTEAQVLNMNAYSVLRTWLTSVRVSNVKYIAPLLDAVFEYCSRTLSQAEKTATKDADLVLAVLVESTNLLDVVATVSEAHRSRCVNKVKAIDCRDASSPHVLIAVLQFFLNHAKEHAAPVADRLFGGSLTGHYMDSSVAFELMSFIRRNLACLCYDTTFLKMYFPCIFKVLAWNPPCCLDDFVVILPAIMCKQTALELIHFLLDLPCLSAALGSNAAVVAAVQQPSAAARTIEVTTGSSSAGGASGGSVSSSSELPAALRPWLTYLLRTKSGSGDTIAKLQVLHSGLAGLADHQRVACSAQASLVLVRKFFQHFLEYCEAEEASHVFQLVLERVCLLYGPAHFQKPMQRLLCDEILRLLDKYPQLVAVHKPDILSWLVSTKVAATNTLVCTHLAWAVGYYCSPAYGDKFTVEMMTEFYETMECLMYETISGQSVGGTLAVTVPQVFGDDNVQLLTTVVTAMAKLACRSHDLVPRVLLCISKLSKLLDAAAAALCSSMAPRSAGDCQPLPPSNNLTILHGRLRELVNLINVPDVASTILNMTVPSKLNRLHLDSSAAPALLETMSALM